LSKKAATLINKDVELIMVKKLEVARRKKHYLLVVNNELDCINKKIQISTYGKERSSKL
jgi:hypothetical protein